MPSPTRTAATGGERLALAALVLAALALRLWLWTTTSGLTMDSPLYVRMGETLARFEHAPANAHHGYSILIALISPLIPGREVPGRIVALIASLACPLFTWAIARRRVGAAPSLWAAALVALHPLIAIYGVAIMTETTYLALTLLGLWLLDDGRALAGGAALGAAFWVRPEALVVGPIAALMLGARRPALLALAGLIVAIAAYLPVLRWQQGAWTLTPKVELLRPATPGAREGPPRFSGDAGAAAADRAQSRGATPADTASALPRRQVTATLAALAADYPGRLARQAARLPLAWPLPLIALSVLGLRRPRLAPWLAPLATPFAYALLDAPPDLRFAQLYVPTLALLAAGGAAWLGERGRAGRSAVAALAACGLAWVWSGPAGAHARRFDDGPMAEMRGAGAWLREHAPADAAVMDRKAYVAFFAHLRHVQLPDESLADLADLARQSGVRYLVAEEYVAAGFRPQLRELLTQPDSAEARYGLRLREAFRTAPGGGVAIFEVLR